MTVSALCAAALVTPRLADAASWHYGSWGNGSCSVAGNGYSVDGRSAYEHTDYDAVAYVFSYYAPDFASAGVQVRGRTFVWNSWGEGPWVNAYGFSSHDCGSASCQYSNCRVRLWY